MSHTYHKLYVHIIWTTKNKEAMINKDIENSISAITKEKCRKFNSTLIAMGNTEDHIHLLFTINPDTKISEIVKEIKGSTSFFVNQKMNQNLFWQNGYGALSVSKSGVDFVKKYIENQKEHHRNKVELVDVLEKFKD